MAARRLGSAILPPALCGLLAGACLEPTQVTLEVTTNAPCGDLDGVQIFLGDLKTLPVSAPVAVAKDCAKGGRIGTLVVAPGGTHEFGVLVVAGVGQETSSCVTNGFRGGCIVAKRALGFIDHRRLSLPIELEMECLNIPCGASETCRNGRCYEATLPDPGSCVDPLECTKLREVGVGGTGGSSSGGGGTGGSSSGGGGTGGSSSGGGGTGGSVSGCGDSTLDSGESCDDGNTQGGDGCSEQCLQERLMVSAVGLRKILLYSMVEGSLLPNSPPRQRLSPLSLPSRCSRQRTARSEREDH